MQKIAEDGRPYAGLMSPGVADVVNPGLSARALQPKPSDLGDFELSMVNAMHVLQRWIVCCTEVMGLKDLGLVDVLVLQHVNHRAHCRRLADICFALNIEDAHIVAYSLRKLIAMQVIRSDKQGKEVGYSTTPLGRECLARYGAAREHCLLDGLSILGIHYAASEELAHFLLKMSGLYDQAARAASSL